MKAWAIALLLGAAGSLRGLTPPPAMEVTELPAPAVSVPVDPALASDRQGRVWLAWVQPAAAAQALFAAELTPSDTWGSAVFVAASAGAREPAIQASPGGTLTALWPAAPPRGAGFAWSRSRDGGARWEGDAVDWPCAAADGCALANGEFLAAWAAPGAAPDLQVRFLTGPYAAAPAFTVIHGAAEPLLQLRPLLDGGALLVFLQRLAPDQIAIASARLHGRRWVKGRGIALAGRSEARSIRLAVDGGRVALVWIQSDTLNASLSPDAGTRFSLPITLASGVDSREFDGSADVALLHDGAAVVVFRQGGALWIQRISPEWTAGQPVPVMPSDAVGEPRIALAHDYGGGNDTATLIVASRVETVDASGVRTFLVRVPEAQLLAAAADDCHCAPTAQQLLGYSIRGTVKRLDAAAGTLVLQADAVPGVMDAGEHTFILAPGERSVLLPGDDCLGRIQSASAGWRIFDLRRLGAAR